MYIFKYEFITLVFSSELSNYSWLLVHFFGSVTFSKIIYFNLVLLCQAKLVSCHHKMYDFLVVNLCFGNKLRPKILTSIEEFEAAYDRTWMWTSASPQNSLPSFIMWRTFAWLRTVVSRKGLSRKANLFTMISSQYRKITNADPLPIQTTHANCLMLFVHIMDVICTLVIPVFFLSLWRNILFITSSLFVLKTDQETLKSSRLLFENWV